MKALGRMTIERAEAYRAGFAEAQRRAAAMARGVGGSPVQPLDGPFVMGQRHCAGTVAEMIEGMHPEGDA
jgi:hypothetical protein